jgi:hypothetical protein
MLSTSDDWEATREKRLQTALAGLRSVYGLYVNED